MLSKRSIWFRFLLFITFCVHLSVPFQISHFDEPWLNRCGQVSKNHGRFLPVVALGVHPSGSRRIKEKSGRRYDLSTINIANEVPRKKSVTTSTSTSTSRDQGGNITTSFILPMRQPDISTQLQYARNGHAVMRQLVPAGPLAQLRTVLVQHGQAQELAAWRQKVQVAADHDPQKAQTLLESSCHTIDDCQKQLRLLLRTDTVSLPFLQYFNTWQSHAAVRDLATSMAEIAAVLMNVTSVRLYQDAIFWKRIGDGPTPWHTDARMAPFDTSHMITIWIPLQPVSQSGLVFCSKSHCDFALPYWNDVALAEQDPSSPWNHLEKRYPSSAACCDYMPLALGDVTVHSGWTLHCADALIPMDVQRLSSETTQQHADADRLALAITYVDALAPVRDPKTFINEKSDKEDMWSYQDWIHDVRYNSSRWNHPLVPILWPSVTNTNGTRSSTSTAKRVKRRKM